MPEQVMHLAVGMGDILCEIVSGDAPGPEEKTMCWDAERVTCPDCLAARAS